MALICLCGVDRTGKSTVAEIYKRNGYVVYHMSAPDKKYTQPGYSGPSYLEDYIEMLMSFQGQDVIMDRFWDGEFVWPSVYDRRPLLSEEDIEIIKEIESSMGASYIMMHDPNVEAHWQRCVENKEPLNKAQFLKARSLYLSLAKKYNFEVKTLQDFMPSVAETNKSIDNESKVDADSAIKSKEIKASSTSTSKADIHMVKLDRANALREILSKPILKSKNDHYSDIEKDIRLFLEIELNKVFGTNIDTSFSKEEISLLKLFCKRLKDKESK
jgi:thymidylate kinase